jgi:hypothetical protein
MQEDGGGKADLDGRTLESCFLVGAATFIMNAGGEFHQLPLVLPCFRLRLPDGALLNPARHGHNS